jgi:hypothetical protein
VDSWNADSPVSGANAHVHERDDGVVAGPGFGIAMPP